VARLKVGGDDNDDQAVSSGAESAEITPAVTPKRRIDVVAEYSVHQKNRETLNLVVVGHVDAGKSTLMGHVLYALGQVNERTMKKFERDAEKIGKGSFAFAWVLDETDEERSRGVTMDIATSAFSTQHRKFTLLDAPGHRDFVPNMISGASRADVAILVVDASTGGFESGFDGNGQTREHAILIRSLGVRQLVVAVNKLDVVEWSETRYLEITNRLVDFLTGCGYVKEDVRFAPVSGLKGVNLAHRITADGTPELASWYHDKDSASEPGPCLVELIDTFTMPERPVSKPFRLAVTDFFKGGTFSSANSVSVTGRISQGNVQIGEHVVMVPGGERGVVKAIDVDFVTEEWAVAGDSVVLMIQGLDIQHISVGSVVCTPERPIQCTTRFEAQLVVFDTPVPITNGFPGLLHMQSLNVPAVVSRIIETFDQRSGEVLKRRPRHIRKGATARVEIVAEAPVCLELFKDSKELGRIMLRKSGETIAAGIYYKYSTSPIVNNYVLPLPVPKPSSIVLPLPPVAVKRVKTVLAVVPLPHALPSNQQSYPLHRKLRLSGYMRRREAGLQLVRRMIKKFGKDLVLVIGNWSASNVKYHEPIHGKKWRYVFQRQGFEVYLINEFRTSCICPVCDSRLENFLPVPNPRVCRRKRKPTVLCHGLLKCSNQDCLQSVEKYSGSDKWRLFNLNLVAVLNFRRIVDSLRKTNKIPEVFKRSAPESQPADRPKSIKRSRNTA
ncbi:hypothetical protein GGI10_004722, partial [Coemansia sp. RSA 2530]